LLDGSFLDSVHSVSSELPGRKSPVDMACQNVQQAHGPARTRARPHNMPGEARPGGRGYSRRRRNRRSWTELGREELNMGQSMVPGPEQRSRRSHTAGYRRPHIASSHASGAKLTGRLGIVRQVVLEITVSAEQSSYHLDFRIGHSKITVRGTEKTPQSIFGVRPPGETPIFFP
jgi:hypothetical protein